MTKVCVIGLGTIGLPLALVLAKANHRVIGVDTNRILLEGIRHCRDRTNNYEKLLLESFLNKQFFITNDLSGAFASSQIVFIAIGTSINPNGMPDWAFYLISLIRFVSTVDANN